MCRQHRTCHTKPRLYFLSDERHIWGFVLALKMWRNHKPGTTKVSAPNKLQPNSATILWYRKYRPSSTSIPHCCSAHFLAGLFYKFFQPVFQHRKTYKPCYQRGKMADQALGYFLFVKSQPETGQARGQQGSRVHMQQLILRNNFSVHSWRHISATEGANNQYSPPFTLISTLVMPCWTQLTTRVNHTSIQVTAGSLPNSTRQTTHILWCSNQTSGTIFIKKMDASISPQCTPPHQPILESS